MRVLCVDDHAVVREGIALVIELHEDIEVVGTASTGEEAVGAFTRLQPDITLLDLELPGMGGINAIREIKKIDRSARIIVLTIHRDAENVFNALDAGATTYLLKDTIPEDLVRVIREVHAGGHPLPEGVAAVLAERARTPALTPSEVNIVKLMAGGLSNKDIGVALGISEDTVRAHLRNIFVKLGATGRTAAVSIAVKRGIVQLK
jgi:DNA-binding NarL/FixJ family response regulator